MKQETYTNPAKNIADGEKRAAENAAAHAEAVRRAEEAARASKKQ